MKQDFLLWLFDWHKNLPSKSFKDLEINPNNTAVISVDMVNGFCHQGPLASNEVKNIIPQVVNVFQKAHDFEVKNFLLIQDAHSEKAEEFNSYPAHCVKESIEAQAIPELKNLSFANQFITIEKNSLSPAYDTNFDNWLSENPQIDTFIIVGNCTDLCVYSMSMHLRLSANSKNEKRKIIVPSNAVATYDLSVQDAQKLGALPHDSNLLHPLFLYHMLLNGVEIVKNI